MNFTGKTLWITGASSGIGKAVAIEMSSKKCHLILSGRKEEELNKLNEEVKLLNLPVVITVTRIIS